MAVDATAIEVSAQLISQHMHVLSKIADRCKTFYTGQVTIEAAAHWALQFRVPERVSIALDLLDHVHFIDGPKLAALLKEAHSKIPATHRDRAIIAAIGKAYDSGPTAGYGFSKSLGLSEAEETLRWRDSSAVLSPADAEASGRSLILLDDNVTSGTQVERYFEEMFPEYDGEREHFPEPLSGAQLGILNETALYVIAAVELSDGRERVGAMAARRGLRISLHSGAKDFQRYLDAGSPIWRDQQEAARARALVADISRQLFEEKHWPPEVLADRLLGYGNLQKLTVFPHNIPKSLLAPFWKAGTYEGRPWMPLFPERREWNAIANIPPDPEIRMIARMIVSGAFGRTSPLCSVAICQDDAPQTAAQCSLPADATLGRIAKALKSGSKDVERLPKAASAVPRSGSGLVRPSDLLLPRHAFTSTATFGISDEDIDAYNKEVDAYREERRRFLEGLEESLAIGGSLVSLPLRVYNDGTAKATETVVELELPEEVEFWPDVPLLPNPPEPPAKPSHGPFASRLLRGLVRPEISLLADIRRRLDPGTAPEDYLRFLKDRGRRILRVYFGKVIQGTFRDRNVDYLRVPRNKEVPIRARLLCEETPRHVETTFSVRPQMESVLPAFLSEAWKKSLKEAE